MVNIYHFPMDPKGYLKTIKVIGFYMDSLSRLHTLPETNSEFTPENGWLEYDPASFWGKRPIFRGKFAVSFREGSHTMDSHGS